MAKHPFEDFVNKQVADSEDLGQLVSREVEITEWQEFLETLYRKIEEFLEPFTSQRTLDCTGSLLEAEVGSEV